MNPPIPGQKVRLAFAIAVAADLLSIALALAPPVQWAVDLATAFSLFVVFGWRWVLLPGLIMEAIPGLYIFPFWILVVGAIAVSGNVRPGSSKSTGPREP